MNRFFTFGAGKKFIEASERLISQAEKTEIFDEIVSYTDADLKIMSDFWPYHGDFISNNPRMYGYGIWKPYLVLKELEGMYDGDVLFYADSGCEFDLHCEIPKDEYKKLLEKLSVHNIIASTCNYDKNMNKMDLVLHLGMLDHPYFAAEQLQATSFIIVKNETTVRFVNEWYRICCNYHMINDKPSLSQNRDDYNEHRHDQSVFSLLFKKMGFFNDDTKNVSVEQVICLSRNRTGIHFPACRVTGSNFFNIHFGDIFIEGEQVIQMSNLVREYKPQNILETGFGSGRTTATVIQSCRELPIQKYVNCDKNYSLYCPVSNDFRKIFHDFFPYFKSYEMRSSDLFRSKILRNEFHDGIDWFTVDGDPTYEGSLCELISVLPIMKKNGIIYIVKDRNSRHNKNIADSTDLFYQLNTDKLDRYNVEIMLKQITYFVVK